ncbi:MAG: methionine adenosyltransferase [Bacilli bacterium]|nr:methionine adenosyltransferase [Bacilli bacterium]
MEKKLFTSESVGPGHPDKLCDQISDAILDEIMCLDPYAHTAIECLATTEFVVVSGEVSGNFDKNKIDYEKIVRDTIRNIGYTDRKLGIGADTCEVKIVIKTQSSDIAQGVNREDTIGAGDQGIMFGYACDETKNYMPLAIDMAHRLMRKANDLRLSGEFKGARLDMKSQVTIDYTNETKIDTILVSIQHDEDIDEKQFKQYIKEKIVDEVVDEYGLNHDYRLLINPTGRFVIGGPEGDTGLTGRKIIVDTYGGSASHGGGAFSGKDCTKVDRSAAYALRYIAKNLVASGLCKRVQLQASYAIGVAEPTSISVNTYGTGVLSDQEILHIVKENFDLTPLGIINTLNLRRPIYLPTATFGHFGRNEGSFSWEKLDKVELLKKYCTK